MTRNALGVLVSLLLIAIGPVLAHDTWLLPGHFAVTPGMTVSLDLTSGADFPAPESVVDADRLAATGVRLGGQTRPLEVKGPGAKALELSATLTSSGVAALWAESRPRTLSLGAKEVEEYLSEIGASSAARARWKSTGHWRESYRKLAKTFVRVGEPVSDRSWVDPVGMELEIVPEEDPTSLHAEGAFRVRVLRGGQGLAGFPVTAEGPGRSSLRTTDASGRVAFQLDEPGFWLIKGTLLEESRAADTDWESLFTTLTVSVGPGR